MTTIIVDYGSGNLHSVAQSFARVAGPDAIRVTEVAADLVTATRIVLPGVGAFADCRAGLVARPGMIEALQEAVIARGLPFMGICVGMQMLADAGHEHGASTAGLGWLKGEVRLIEPADPALKVPHMGWNDLVIDRPHPVLAGLSPGAHAYFVHSYALTGGDPAQAIAHCDHGGKIAAVVGRDNIVGTQFHPEKSQATGLRLIANFLGWKP